MTTDHLSLLAAKGLVQRHEGCRLTAYDDATGKPIGPGDTLKGHPTIGWGRALDVHGLTQEEADWLLERDLRAAQEIAAEFAGPAAWEQTLNHYRRAVLIDMAHNLGRAGLFGFRMFRLALQAGDYAAAAAQMLDSKWAQQVKGRAATLAAMMGTGSDPSAGPLTHYGDPDSQEDDKHELRGGGGA